jgi:hypothetical protein
MGQIPTHTELIPLKEKLTHQKKIRWKKSSSDKNYLPTFPKPKNDRMRTEKAIPQKHI